MLRVAVGMAAIVIMTAAGCISDTAYHVCFEDTDCSAPTSACTVFFIDYPDYVASDSYCSMPCDSDDECPAGWNGFGAGCVYLRAGATSYCMMRCGDDFDCSPGFACSTEGNGLSFGQAVCVPL